MAARSIEARLVISGDDKGAAKAVSNVTKALDQLAKTKAPSAAIQALNERLEQTQASLKKVERVRETAARVAEAGMAFKQADARVKGFASALDNARKAGKSAEEIRGLTNQLQSAQRAFRGTEAALRTQATAAQAARSAMNALGVPVTSLTAHEAALARSINATTRAMERRMEVERREAEVAKRTAAVRQAAAAQAAAREARSAARKDAAGTVAASVGGVAAYKGKQIGLQAIESAADFDIAVRKQKVITEVSDPMSEQLMKQAKRIGAETQFSNKDVVLAQTASMQGLPAKFGADLKAEIGQGIVENVRSYAILMDTDLKEGSEIIRGYLQQTGKDISTKQKALDEANTATNKLVKMAKLGGMDAEDVKNFASYGFASGTAGGLSTDSLMTLGALARRGGLRGDVAGVAVRSMASKLNAPTRDGISALNAAGIRFSDHVRMPDSLNTSGLEGQFKLTMGKGFTPEIRKRLDAINANKDLVANREDYVAAVTEAVSPILGKKKDGTVRASDSKVAAKAANQFHKMSGAGVDAEGLLNAIMSSGMTLPQLNAFFTDKHGGKFAITQKQWDEFQASRKEIAKTGDDPNFARKRADYVMGGVGGSVENLKGSWENLVLALGEANKGLIKFTSDGIGKGLDAFANLSQTSQQVLTAVGVAAGVSGGAYSAVKIGGKLLGFGGAGSLGASAVALNESAAALTAAAIKLGADPGDIKKAVKAGGPAAGALVAGAVVGGVAVGGTAASVVATEAVKNKEFREPYLDGGMLGADPGGYGLGAAIVAAPELAQRMSEQNKRIAEEKGKEAGKAAASGVADGVKENAPKAEEEAKSLYERLKKVFQDGIKVPIKVEGGDGLSGASGSDGLAGGMGGDTLGGLGAGTGSGRGGLRRLGGGGGSVVPNGEAGPGTGTGDSWYEAVMRAEGTAGKDPYNVVLGKGKYGLPSKPLTDMTLAEAYRFGRSVRARHGASSALGAFQIVGRTMKEHMKHTGLGWDDRFSPENQRKLADSIRQREGWGAREGLKIHRGELARARRGSGTIADAPKKPEIPPAPAPGALRRGSGDLGAAADRMAAAASRMENANFYGRVDVAVSADAGLKAQAKRMRATGTMTADMGLSMPGAKDNGLA